MITILISVGCISALVSAGALVYAGVQAVHEELNEHRQRQGRPHAR